MTATWTPLPEEICSATVKGETPGHSFIRISRSITEVTPYWLCAKCGEKRPIRKAAP